MTIENFTGDEFVIWPYQSIKVIEKSNKKLLYYYSESIFDQRVNQTSMIIRSVSYNYLERSLFLQEVLVYNSENCDVSCAIITTDEGKVAEIKYSKHLNESSINFPSENPNVFVQQLQQGETITIWQIQSIDNLIFLPVQSTNPNGTGTYFIILDLQNNNTFTQPISDINEDFLLETYIIDEKTLGFILLDFDQGNTLTFYVLLINFGSQNEDFTLRFVFANFSLITLILFVVLICKKRSTKSIKSNQIYPEN